MTTNGKVVPEFWGNISIEDTPANGWQKLQVDTVDTVKSSADFEWLGDQIQINLRCIISEGQHSGVFANCTLRVGGSTGTTRDGRQFTIKEEDSLNTALGRIGRILDVARTHSYPDLDDPKMLLNPAKLQAVAESLEGANFYGNVTTNANGFANVGNGITAIRSASNPPDQFPSAVPAGFSS